jgi:hypothetical protein
VNRAASAVLRKELRELVLGRAIWALYLSVSVLVGVSFRDALALYGEASKAAARAPELARALSPFDGILVPTFGAVYLTATFLWPFVAIRQLGVDVRSGGMTLWRQLPVPPGSFLVAKLVALATGWVGVLAIPMLAVVLWWGQGGHVSLAELAALLVGHSLYALVITALAMAAAAWVDTSATAPLVVLAATLGSWVLDYADPSSGAGLGGLAAVSLTRILRSWEAGVVEAGPSAAWIVTAIALLLAVRPGLAHHYGPRRRATVVAAVAAVGVMLVAASAALRFNWDVTEDRRNSFSLGEEAVLSRLQHELRVDVALRPEDPRFQDFDRSVLAKLRRSVSRLSVNPMVSGATRVELGTDDRYGEIAYTYRGNTQVTRSTSPRESLAILWAVTGQSPVHSAPVAYPGYPLVASDSWSRICFLGILPAAIGVAASARWWWRPRPRLW